MGTTDKEEKEEEARERAAELHKWGRNRQQASVNLRSYLPEVFPLPGGLHSVLPSQSIKTQRNHKGSRTEY